MDYANSRRIKVWGTAKVVEDDEELLESLSDPDYPGKVERAIVFTVEARDINCPQHIHRRILLEDAETIIEEQRIRIEHLQEKLARLQAGNLNPDESSLNEDQVSLQL